MEHYSMSVNFAMLSDQGGRHVYQQLWLSVTPARAPEPVAPLAYAFIKYSNSSPRWLNASDHLVGSDQPRPDPGSVFHADIMEASDYEPDATTYTDIRRFMCREFLDLHTVLALPVSQ